MTMMVRPDELRLLSFAYRDRHNENAEKERAASERQFMKDMTRQFSSVVKEFPDRAREVSRLGGSSVVILCMTTEEDFESVVKWGKAYFGEYGFEVDMVFYPSENGLPAIGELTVRW